MKIKTLLLSSILALSSTNLLADNNMSLIVGGFSKHFGSGDYNETNTAIGVRYNDYDVIVFKNSYNNTSFVFAKTAFVNYSQSENYKVDVGFRYGLTTGYDKMPVMPFAQGLVSISHNQKAIELGMLNFAVIGVNFRYDF
ncbi:hypothetical protein VmeM32_00156 [Vibrio phage vB_VmeM-32]|nr:hypothetical protein VmeM32_00156 [Vibrio phage vB_VmeM-32]